MPYQHITSSERVAIETMLKLGLPQSLIAKELGRCRSTVSREIRRNADPRGRYVAVKGQHKYLDRRKCCRPAKKLEDGELLGHVKQCLAKGWSPEEISGRMRLEHPANPKMRVSHETIYLFVYGEKRQGGRLWENLRRSRKKRRKRGASRGIRGIIKGRRPIGERPSVVDARDRPGDWEGDTIIGAGRQGAVATFVERSSRFLVAAPMPDKSAAAMCRAARRAFCGVPAHMLHTLTVDNGKEFAQFRQIERDTAMTVYFADPYRACQRGLNENTNGLLRQYLPKSKSLKGLSQDELNQHVRMLNNRPRKCLLYRTPAEVFLTPPVALRL